MHNLDPLGDHWTQERRCFFPGRACDNGRLNNPRFLPLVNRETRVTEYASLPAFPFPPPCNFLELDVFRLTRREI